MKNNRLIQVAVFLAGLFYLLAALGLLFAPGWFFEYIGHFPPYNRHYMGDTGAFLLPLALGLLVAARDPSRYRFLIGLGALASVIHTFNHLYDAAFEGLTHGHWLLDLTPLFLLAMALIAAYYQPASTQGELRQSEPYGTGRGI